MIYKGFIGEINIDEDEGIIYGRVINISRDKISFEGKTVEEAKKDFQEAVDDYLEWAKEDGFEPEKPFRGEIMFRPGPELHKEIAMAASIVHASSINQFLVEAVTEKISDLKQQGKIPQEKVS